MKLKLLLWIFVLIVLSSPIFALWGTSCNPDTESSNPDDYNAYENFDTDNTVPTGWTCSAGTCDWNDGSQFISGNGSLTGASNAEATFPAQIKSGIVTYETYIRLDSAPNLAIVLFVHDWARLITWTVTSEWATYNGDGGSWAQFGSYVINTWYKTVFRMDYTQNNFTAYIYYVNGTLQSTSGSRTPTGVGGDFWQLGPGLEEAFWDNVRIYNGTTCPITEVDTTPPTNSTWNVTSPVVSGQSRISWNTDGLNQINITEDNLSVTFNTNEPTNSSCRMDVEQNYTQMVTQGGFCYQESANVSTACGGLSTGSYTDDGQWDASKPATETYDGDWTTWGWVDDEAYDNATVWVNYTKPSGALNSSLWQVLGWWNQAATNLSINSSCWNAYPNILSFKYLSNNLTPRNGFFYCYNSTKWILMHQDPLQRLITEEAMQWNMSGEGDVNYKCETTDTTSHSCALFDTIPLGNHFMCCDMIDSSGNERPSGTCAAKLNFTFIDTIAPTFNETPENKTLEFYTDSLYIKINGSDNVAIDTFYINDTSIFNISTKGLLRNTSSMPEDTTHILISLNDTSNNIKSIVFQLIVQDTIAPAVTLSANRTLEFKTDSLTADINATDPSGLNATPFRINDTTNFNISSSGLIRNKTALSIKTYVIIVSAIDNSNNKNVNNTHFGVTVQDTIAPTLDCPPNVTLEYNIDSLGKQCNATDLSGIDTFSINDSTNFKINASGYLENNTALSIKVHKVNVSVNDTQGNTNSTVYQVTVKDLTFPLIDFAGGTATNNTIVRRDWIFINVSVTEANFKNITFYLYNSSGLVSSNTKVVETFNHNFTSILVLVDFDSSKAFYYNVTICDTSSNCNSTNTRRINLQPSYVEFNVTNTTGTLDFYPMQSIQTEVEAWGQTSVVGGITLDNNLAGSIDVYVKLNKTRPRITLKLGNTSTYSNSIIINTSYQRILNNLNTTTNQYIWAWADYNAPTVVWDPKLDIVGLKV